MQASPKELSTAQSLMHLTWASASQALWLFQQHGNKCHGSCHPFLQTPLFTMDFSAYFTHPSCIKITSGLEWKIIPCIGVACSAHSLTHQSLTILQEHFQRAIPPLVQFNDLGAVRALCFMPGSDHYCKLMPCLDLGSEPLGTITAQART